MRSPPSWDHMHNFQNNAFREGVFIESKLGTELVSEYIYRERCIYRERYIYRGYT